MPPNVLSEEQRANLRARHAKHTPEQWADTLQRWRGYVASNVAKRMLEGKAHRATYQNFHSDLELWQAVVSYAESLPPRDPPLP